MAPGYEILNLWVSRMILMSGFLLGEVPFKTVLIHGLVRAKDGRKFSKSLNNGVDPLDMIEKYGADALRMGLLVGSAIGNDVKFDEQRIKGYGKFSNKLWNISRFVLENAGDAPVEVADTPDDTARREELSALIVDVTTDMEAYRLYLASEKLYHYIWHTFADTILEESKPILKGEAIPARDSRKRLLIDILKASLALLHPFMPFITEELWSHMPRTDGGLLMVAPWPSP